MGFVYWITLWYQLSFSLDAQYDLAFRINNPGVNASTIINNHIDESYLPLLHDTRFCVEYFKGCATWIEYDANYEASNTDIIKQAKKTLFAVKTCKKYHRERLPIIFDTWGKAALNIEYFSEYASRKYKTKVLPRVQQNTEKGHCQKTEAILK